MTKTCKRHLVIWRPDANGQIGKKNERENGEPATQEHATEKIIGPNTNAARTEMGNRMKLRKACPKQQAIPMET